MEFMNIALAVIWSIYASWLFIKKKNNELYFSFIITLLFLILAKL